jgi:acetyl/propionyl-CoA carboxylase alpha subunit
MKGGTACSADYSKAMAKATLLNGSDRETAIAAAEAALAECNVGGKSRRNRGKKSKKSRKNKSRRFRKKSSKFFMW